MVNREWVIKRHYNQAHPNALLTITTAYIIDKHDRCWARHPFTNHWHGNAELIAISRSRLDARIATATYERLNSENITIEYKEYE